MKIGELARATGVSHRLLRYYEEQGLLVSHRAESGHRSYSDEAPVIVGHIRALLAAGLPTSVIRQVLPCVEGPGPELNVCIADVLQTQLRELEEKMDTLQHAHTALSSLLATTTN